MTARNQQQIPILQHFDYKHLPARLQSVSRPFCELARQVATLPRNAESRTALRKLLEAKDAAVRAVLQDESELASALSELSAEATQRARTNPASSSASDAKEEH